MAINQKSTGWEYDLHDPQNKSCTIQSMATSFVHEETMLKSINTCTIQSVLSWSHSLTTSKADICEWNTWHLQKACFQIWNLCACLNLLAVLYCCCNVVLSKAWVKNQFESTQARSSMSFIFCVFLCEREFCWLAPCSLLSGSLVTRTQILPETVTEVLTN